MISIDTDMLRQLAAAAKEANEAIENATLRLTAITEHRDWGVVISEAAVSAVDSVIKDIPQFKPAVDMPGAVICNFNDIDLSAGGEK